MSYWKVYWRHFVKPTEIGALKQKCNFHLSQLLFILQIESYWVQIWVKASSQSSEHINSCWLIWLVWPWDFFFSLLICTLNMAFGVLSLHFFQLLQKVTKLFSSEHEHILKSKFHHCATKSLILFDKDLPLTFYPLSFKIAV